MYDNRNKTKVIPAIQIAAIGLKTATIMMIITRIKNHLLPIVLKNTTYFFGIIYKFTTVNGNINYNRSHKKIVFTQNLVSLKEERNI